MHTCSKCKATNPDDAKYCNQCGTKMPMPFNVKKYIESMPIEYTAPEQLWEITTEGDCEGRTVKELGTHKGYLVDLAARFADQACYTLYFKAVEAKTLPECKELPVDGVAVALDIKSTTWDLNPQQRALVMQEILSRYSPGSVKVEPGTYYASFVLKPR